MNSEEIVAYIVNEVAPLYDHLSEKRKLTYHAILQSLPFNTLNELSNLLSAKRRVPWDLLSFIEWWQSKIGADEPIGTLLSWFKNKESHRVSYAFKCLTRRYDSECFDNQTEILRALLRGNKTSSEWAARRLYKQWYPGLEREVIDAWRAHKGPAMARTIIRVLPHEIDLQKDESHLSILDWFIIVGRLCLTDRIPEMDEKANQYILGLNWEHYLAGYEERVGENLYEILEMNSVLWAMKRVGYTAGLIRLSHIEQLAIKMTQNNNGINHRFASLVFFLQYLLKEDLEDESLYNRAINAWLSQEKFLY